MNIQNDKIQKDPLQPGFGTVPPQVGEPVPVPVEAPKAPSPIIGGPSVVLSTAGGGIDAMVAKLKAERDNAREDYARTQLASALSAVLDRVHVRDAELQKILDALKLKNGKLEDLQKLAGKLEGAIDTTKIDLLNLQLKIKKLEAAIEALKKTPEDKKKEIEFQRKMAELKDKLAKAKGEETKLVDKLNNLNKDWSATKGQIKSLTKDINDLLVKLDALSGGAVTQALKDLGVDVDTAPETEAEKAAGKVNGMSALLRLLAGEEQTLKDAVEEKRPNMV